jgi:hypothetical protein
MEGFPVRKLLLMLAFFVTTHGLAAADALKLRDDAPERYVVVKGDTLWEISARYLDHPWSWPQLWKFNREQIRDPHWIYPGDLIVLDRSGASPSLSLVRGDRHGMNTVKLSPGARSTSLTDGPVPTIPLSAIHPFLSQPRVVSAGDLDSAAFVLGTNEERLALARGDEVYATAGKPQTTRWTILRPGKALVDPDTGETLGYEVEYIGDAVTIKTGMPQKIRITHSAQEILPRDKLLPADDEERFEYLPHPPEKDIEGRIVSAYGGVSDTGRYQTVVLNRGRRDGLEPGHVLAVHHTGRTVNLRDPETDPPSRWAYLDKGCIRSGEKVTSGEFYDPRKVMTDCKSGTGEAGPWVYLDVGCIKPGKKVAFGDFFNPRDVYDPKCGNGAIMPDSMQLPDERTGLVMVYRVYDKVSYALIMQSSRPVYLLDSVRRP